jgi:tetratricopeptide (TPR) repeat protein
MIRNAHAARTLVAIAACAIVAAVGATSIGAQERNTGKSVGQSLADARARAEDAKDADEALDLWEEVLALEPPGNIAAEALWMRGQAARSLGLFPEAASLFDRLAQNHRRHFDKGKALLAKGLAELEAGEPRAALESLRDAVRSARDANDRAQAELAFASANYRLGNVGEALRRFDRFQSDHPRDDRALWAAWRSVICLRLSGREREAVERTEHLENEAPGTLAAMLARQEVRMGGNVPRDSAAKTPPAKEAEEPKESEEKEPGTP